MVRAVVLIALVLFCGNVAGQSPTSFTSCYVGCYALCSLVNPNNPLDCGLNCLKICINPKIPQATTTTTHLDNNFNFCKLGCAASLCTNISTKQNPGGEKVESCVISCSEQCTKNYLSP